MSLLLSIAIALCILLLLCHYYYRSIREAKKGQFNITCRIVLIAIPLISAYAIYFSGTINLMFLIIPFVLMLFFITTYIIYKKSEPDHREAIQETTVNEPENETTEDSIAFQTQFDDLSNTAEEFEPLDEIMEELNFQQMILVEEGEFLMGYHEGGYNERPVHLVKLSPYYIGKYPITQKEWKIINKFNPSYFNRDLCPVERVSWYQAVEFCNKKSIEEGYAPCYSIKGNIVTCDFSKGGYRLPTEAEWEYACRGGALAEDEFKFDLDSINDYVWFKDNAYGQTHSVGVKLANPLGIHDMSGNVYEWCWDRYSIYPDHEVQNPKGDDYIHHRIIRGGYYEGERSCRPSFRGFFAPEYSFKGLGFRVVRNYR